MAKKGSGAPQINVQQEMERQEQMMQRQMALQQQYQREAEDRMRQERERERVAEATRRIDAANAKEQRLKEQESQEAAVFQEMQGQTSKEQTEFGGGFNLAMPTIERPGYEQETRPE